MRVSQHTSNFFPTAFSKLHLNFHMSVLSLLGCSHSFRGTGCSIAILDFRPRAFLPQNKMCQERSSLARVEVNNAASQSLEILRVALTGECMLRAQRLGLPVQVWLDFNLYSSRSDYEQMEIMYRTWFLLERY